MEVYLKSTQDVRRLIEEGKMRDVGGDGAKRFSKQEVFHAINSAINSWHGNVRTEFIYSPVSSASSNVVTLPNYMEPRFLRPEWRITSTGAYPNISPSWESMTGYVIQPLPDGTYEMRTPPNDGYYFSATWRVRHWQKQGEVPVADVELSSALAIGDTEAVVTGSLDMVGQCGYIKVGAEWVSYQGKTYTSTTTTLHNLTRGVNFSTEAAHDAGATVLWGIAVDQPSVWLQLGDAVRAELYNLIMNETVNEADYQRRERQMRIAEQKAHEAFWSTYTPTFQPRINIKPPSFDIGRAM